MKKILFILAILPMMSFAQKGFEPSIKAGYEIALDDNQSFGAQFVAGYRVSDLFRIGVGTGIYWCEHLYEEEFKSYDAYKETALYVPVFVNGKVNFVNKGISPYFSVDLGYSIFVACSDYAENNKLGIFANPAIIDSLVIVFHLLEIISFIFFS